MKSNRYRGKRILDDKWVYGAYINQGNNHFIIPKVNKNGYAKCIAVYVDTVSRFVVNHNHEEFFEGDILSYNHGEDYGIIEYNEDYKKYLVAMESKIYYSIDSIDAFIKVGNRWDTPKLLDKINNEV